MLLDNNIVGKARTPKMYNVCLDTSRNHIGSFAPYSITNMNNFYCTVHIDNSSFPMKYMAILYISIT